MSLEGKIKVCSTSSGSFGSVDVYTKSLEHLSVVKKISKKNTEPAEFSSEVSILQKVSKFRNVPKFLCSWEDRRNYYIEMSFIPGKNLFQFQQDLIDGLAVITPEDLKQIFTGMTLRLADLHKAQILHLDIKLQNYIISENEIYLVDFGFSLSESEGAKNREEFGTRYYKAPEVYQQKGKFQATDIFALGCAFYYFLHSEHLFSLTRSERKTLNKFDDSENGKSEIEEHKDRMIRGKVKRGDFSNFRTGVADFTRLLKSMISVEPEKRPSALQVLEALDSIEDWSKIRSDFVSRK